MGALDRLTGPLVAAGIAAAIALPFWAPSPYAVYVAINAALFTVAAMSLNLVYGFAGLLSFAQLGFWGIGAYVAAIGVKDLGLPIIPAFLLAGAVCAVVAAGVGHAALRLNRHSFVVVSIAFTLLVLTLARDWTEVTRGALGIPGLGLPRPFGLTPPGDSYYVALAFSLPALGLLLVIARSRVGRTLLAIRQDESLARSHGIAPRAYRLFAFVVAAALTGIAGAIFVFHLTIVDPLILDIYYMQTFLIMVILGGMGSFWGVVVAGILMSILPEALRFSNDLRMILYGLLLILAVTFMPYGFAGWLKARRGEVWRRATPATRLPAGDA
ncbi:branched-chain amino acid ABC transporter permease [Falsiroseomonas oryzae]|uniref:branched-chain amino acid ABC transporter permease n=1 Tax=Falsiroseomonas oryzae TaxID=2766473 RepID=UPI0022EB6838|nr:branched-chain amino acid ABC transporter permease [Roseomonas sp. MO-31]